MLEHKGCVPPRTGSSEESGQSVPLVPPHLVCNASILPFGRRGQSCLQRRVAASNCGRPSVAIVQDRCARSHDHRLTLNSKRSFTHCLIALSPGILHATHNFRVGPLSVSTRMTVVRLDGDSLWLHSPIPLDNGLRAELDILGVVRAIVTPNKMHHLFLTPCAAAFPAAVVYGAPGLAEKRPDVPRLQKFPRTARLFRAFCGKSGQS
ncbi:DUF4336 domain-containing protein [Paucibacter sp. R3-3]|uniref:DUF4336 domain-containing protein n=1 Tax=Roseateles agri TaxID=3098619 RepID=A0ABU5DR26_9BURK|nr:DUF4336 domain-containing protein [Paucibacter sp. R3-3]MDY0748095.1 DUF4336 domain-containing protein [Paucibacter sp. R3-3]